MPTSNLPGRTRRGPGANERLIAAAAQSAVPDGLVSHHTAARLWGAVVPDSDTSHVTVSNSSRRRSRRGLTCHVNRGHVQVATVGGVRVTSPEQTFVDLAPYLTLVDLVVAGDGLVQAGVASVQSLSAAAHSAKGRGSRRAVDAVDLVRAGSESPMETRTRLLIVMAGLPEPCLNLRVDREDTFFRLDLPYPQVQVAVEYDGRHHVTDPFAATRPSGLWESCTCTISHGRPGVSRAEGPV